MDSLQSPKINEPGQLRTGLDWRRILKWSLIIYVSVSSVAFFSGLSMAFWHLYGPTLEQAVETNRQVRTVAYWATAALLYWRFAVPLRSRRLLQVAMVLVLFELITALVLVLAFGNPVSELWEPWAFGRSVVAATVGLGLASLGSNNSSKPTPLRGAA
jgi:magnesium-transporting ATPase (P-type)